MPSRTLVKLISKRYFLRMMTQRSNSDEIAEYLVHIGRSARAEASGAELTAAQWPGLRFFARANRASRTPSAFASFQATTRGTASQTVKSLESKGFLRRRKCDHDGRSVRFEVTEAGQAMLKSDPLRHLIAAISRLPEAERAALARALPVLSADVAAMRGVNAFGTCGDCAHFADGKGGGYCACVAAGLAPEEIGQMCASFALRLPDTEHAAAANKQAANKQKEQS